MNTTRRVGLDIIRLRLIVLGRVGLKDDERKKPQRLELEVDLKLDLNPAANSDCIDDSVNYAAVRREIEGLLANRSFVLLETIAVTVAQMILRHEKVYSVDVTIRKLDVWPNGTPAVIISRIKTAPTSV